MIWIKFEQDIRPVAVIKSLRFALFLIMNNKPPNTNISEKYADGM